MMKKILKILGVIILLLAITLFAVIIYLGHHPEIALRIVSQPIKEDQVAEVSYTYNYDKESETDAIPDFAFRPSGSGNYTFSAIDLESSTEVYMTMSVTDKSLNDHFIADNLGRRNGSLKNEIYGTATLQEDQETYILFTVEPVNGDLSQFSGSFKLIVTKDKDDAGPPQLTMDGPVNVTVSGGGQGCALFVPPETGYYRFENSLVSRDSSIGYSSLSSITTTGRSKVSVTSDISMLQKDKEYYVWVVANESNRRRSRVQLSCSLLKTEKATGICYLDLSGESVIEYVADKACNLAVYTVSGGDPRAVIYDKEGYPLRTDDTSDTSLSDNPHDIATVLKVEKGTLLHICVYGDVTDCRVFITEYTGDGTTFTKDDLTPLPESAPAH